MSNAQLSGTSTPQASVPTAGNGSGGVGTRPVHWPSAQEFNEAIQNLGYSMSDDELKGGEPAVNKLGLPMPYSGGFADIYRVHCPVTNNTWAVKCFTRGAVGLQQRYAAISQHLKSVDLPFMVDFDYIDQGIRIAGAWYPIVKMRWIEGLNLNAFVAQSVQQPATLDQLFDLWVRLSSRLRQAGIAHADLQHGNVLLVQRPGTDRLSLRLIDYDGMYVPALAGQRSGEVGHPAFQHPQRLREGTYSRDVDRFSHLSICCAVRALRVGGRELWDKYDNGQNLLFVEKDFAAPQESALFQDLAKLRDPLVQVLAARLALASLARLEQTPAIDELVADDWLSQLSRNDSTRRPTLPEPALRTVPPASSPQPVVPTEAPPSRVDVTDYSALIDDTPTTPDADRNDVRPPPPAARQRAEEIARELERRGIRVGSARNPGWMPAALRRIDDWLCNGIGPNRPRLLDAARCALILIVVSVVTMLVVMVDRATRGGGRPTSTDESAFPASPVDGASSENVAPLGPAAKAGEKLAINVKGETVTFRWCPPGSFVMGSPASELGRRKDEERVTVTLSQGFWMMETECWQKLWLAVMGAKKTWNKGQGDRYPAYYVSHQEATAFAQRFSDFLRSDLALSGKWTPSLPTEAQWEYAMRADSSAEFCFGKDLLQLGDYAWYSNNAGQSNHPVGEKWPNQWGIRDGHGSVWEWTADWYAETLSGRVDPSGPASGIFRVVRGGSWNLEPAICRSACRYRYAPADRNYDLGFRLVLNPSQ